MRFQNSAGRFFRPANRDLMRVTIKARQWMIAGTLISTFDDLMDELDAVTSRHPHLERRAACVRAVLLNAVLGSIISIPMEASVL